MNRRIIAATLAALTLVALSVVPAFASARRDSTTINGAGSSFDAPLFNSAFAGYHKSHSGVNVNYASLGSGTGQKDINAKTVDFGAFDVPMGIKGDSFSNLSQITQIPVTLGAEAITYDLPHYTAGALRLTGADLAGIYLGTITKWTNSALTKLNPGLKHLKGQSDEKIIPVHRCDGSGTTYIFTDYMSSVNSSFRKTVGPSKLPAWPGNNPCGAQSAGVDAIVNKTPGALGYAELAYAIQNNKTPAYILNKSGKYLQPSVNGASQDAAAVTKISPSKFSIVNRKGAKAYPLSGFSWVGLYTKGSNWGNKGNCGPTVAAFKWLDSSATQKKYGPSNYYAGLPKSILKYADSQLKKINCSK